MTNLKYRGLASLLMIGLALPAIAQTTPAPTATPTPVGAVPSDATAVKADPGTPAVAKPAHKTSLKAHKTHKHHIQATPVAARVTDTGSAPK